MLNVGNPGPDYTLRWPRELFRLEGEALFASAPLLLKKTCTDQVEWFLEEAFPSSMPKTDFRQSDQKSTWTDDEAAGIFRATPYLRDPLLFLRALLRAVDKLPEQASPRPYYAARHNKVTAGVPQADPLAVQLNSPPR